MTRLFLILVFGIPWLLLPQPMARAESLEYVFGAASGTVKGFDFAALENSSSKKVIRGGGLQINHVGQKVPLPSVGGKTRFGLRGDFEIELSFLVEELGIPTSGDGSGIMLRLEYADKEQSGLTLALNASPNELLFWQIDNTTNGQQNHQVDKRPAFTNVFESPQTIRVKRSGGQITAIAGAAETNTEFSSPVFTNADVSSVAMWISTGGASADMAVELKRLRIEADEFANDIAAPSGASSWTIIFWVFAVLLGLAGAYWYWQTLQP